MTAMNVDDSQIHIDRLHAFVNEFVIENELVVEKLTLTPLTGDAGFRKYFRSNTTPSVIAVFAPPATEKNAEFCEIGMFLREHDIRAPQILGKDLDRGFFILEDFGDALLLDLLDDNTVDAHYEAACTALLKLQLSHQKNSLFPTYDARLLRQEMDLFDEWYVMQLLDLSLSAEDLVLIDEVKQRLSDAALNQPQVFVHRDFHARNLMLLDNGEIGVIDFQDAVIGPVTYDLVSLLKDCYARWDFSRVEAWALMHLERLNYRGLLIGVEPSDFLKSFHLMGLQRHLKVLGIFARLYLRDGKSRYLDDLPRVTDYVLEAAALYPEFLEFETFLRQKIVPVAQSKGWA